jgi:hypothetical protein
LGAFVLRRSTASSHTICNKAISTELHVKHPARNLRVGHEDVYTVFGILLVLSLSFENELLQDVIISCYNAIE